MGATPPPEERRVEAHQRSGRGYDNVVADLASRLDVIDKTLHDISDGFVNVISRLSVIEHTQIDINAQLEKTHGWRLMLIVWGVGILTAVAAYGGSLLQWWLSKKGH